MMETKENNIVQSNNQQTPVNGNDELELTYSSIISIGWLVTIGVSILYLIVGLIFWFGEWFENIPKTWYEWPVSYFFGAMVNFLAFNSLKKNIASLTSETGKLSAPTNYLIRLAIYSLMLVFAFTSEHLNPYVVATGFLTIKASIYIFAFKEKKGKN